MKWYQYIFILLCFSLSHVMAIPFDRTKYKDETPWFTGTFLAYGPVCLNPGTFNLQFYMTFVSDYGHYNNRGEVQNTPSIFEMTPFFVFAQMGLFKNVDINFMTQCFYESSQGSSDVHWGPSSLYLGFQLMRSKKDTWKPNIRFLINGVFPSGPFDKLNASVRDIGSGTNGSYQVGPTLVVQKIFYNVPGHPYSINLNATYLYQTRATLNGFNFYGGDVFSRGVAKPGSIWNFNFASEFLITKNIGIGSDLNYNYSGPVRYNSIVGDVDLSQEPSQTLVITPMIEYNFSVNRGVFASGWLTIWGQNTSAFAGGVISAFFTF